MSAICFTGGRVLIDNELRNDLVVRVSDGRILDVCECPAADDELLALDGQYLLPGFTDLQVNGGGGVLFNDAPTVETITTIGEAHRRYGTTGFLPTLISDDLDKVATAIAAVDEAIASGVPGVLGIHLEGPFLNPARRGVHDETWFRPLGEAEVNLLCTLRNGRTLVTLAPDAVPVERISELARRNVIVAAGHTDADYDTIRKAIDAGLRGFTHLYNAMSPLASREPGVVGAALDNDDCWCGIIADGFHVHPASLRIASRAKPADKLVLVTDAMPGVGSDIDSFEISGERITIENDRCTTASGTLAGSQLNMAAAVRNAVHLLKLDLATAVRMASRNPAAALGIDDLGGIRAGAIANLVSADSDFNVTGTWINGLAMPIQE